MLVWSSEWVSEYDGRGGWELGALTCLGNVRPPINYASKSVYSPNSCAEMDIQSLGMNNVIDPLDALIMTISLTPFTATRMDNS